MGQPSAPQAVTLTNNQSVSLTITSITTSGDYSQTNNCGTLAAGKLKLHHQRRVHADD